MTYLDAINRLLGFVGTRKVAIVDTRHPDIEKADRFLKEKKTMLLKRGWWFNRVMGIELVPDTETTELIFPVNALSFNLFDSRVGRNHTSALQSPDIIDNGARTTYPKLTMRGNKMFDAWRNQYTFEESILVNINLDIDWDDLPDSAQMYIIYEAGEEFVSDVLEDTAKEKKLNDKRKIAWMELRTEEINTSGANLFDGVRAQNARRGRRPFSQTAGIRGRYT